MSSSSPIPMLTKFFGEGWTMNHHSDSDEERLHNLKEAQAFFILWENHLTNQRNSLLEWLYNNFGIDRIEFCVVLCDPDGHRRYPLYINRRGRDEDGGMWAKDCLWLDLT